MADRWDESHAFLSGLNQAQREAVLHDGGPLLILAGAGSGKTRVVTVRIAWMIRELGYDPASILALTFTNKAAREMRDRAAALEPRASDVMLRTFHSFGAWFLRRNARLAGLDPNFNIYDDEDTLSLLATVYPGQNRPLLKNYATLISRMKDHGLGPDDDPGALASLPDLPEVYRAYQDRLEQTGNCDFGDLILKPLRLLREDPAVARRFHDRFRVILVDEYQDSNMAQYELLKALTGPDTRIGVVGDDDQSIYRFRGAEVKNILDFPDHFPGTRVIRLEENYRSTNPILQVADAVVSHNESRLGKTMFTRRPGGDLPRLWMHGDQDMEIHRIIGLLDDGSLEGTAILYRTNAQSRAFETAFLQAGIPYRIVGSLRFYEREEVKDALALMRLVANPRDELAFRRMVNKPARGVGPASLDRLLSGVGTRGGDVVQAARDAVQGLSRKAATGVKTFLDLMEELRGILGAGGVHLGDFAAAVMESSGLRELYGQEDRIAGTQKLSNLEELVNAASIFSCTMDGLVEYLETVELDAGREDDDADNRGKVTLITMHNTKGLEFDRVIITGLEDGICPRNPDDADELEEERRLLYVALTRARTSLILCTCAFRRMHGQLRSLSPSRFLSEIPRELLEVSDEGFQSARQAFRGGSSGFGSGAPGARTASGMWPRGCAVYHDDYGPGRVVKSWYEEGEEAVLVEFETGRSARFIPRYSSLERMSR